MYVMANLLRINMSDEHTEYQNMASTASLKIAIASLGVVILVQLKVAFCLMR